MDVSFCNFSIAESYPTSKKDEKNETVYDTRWHDITAWEGVAKKLEKYSKKGSLITISGRLEYDTYEKDGVNIKRAKIIADNAEISERKLN
ncbi:MAG: single-stranded DNA-binding protein [Leptospiraceae bacterium]|nr:single-stranded DNA-binding protein [Leptospiraceae bacterium]